MCNDFTLIMMFFGSSIFGGIVGYIINEQLHINSQESNKEKNG